MSIDAKSEVKVEKRQFVAKLKLKMLNMQKVTFSTSTPPPGGAFELLLHFSYIWNIVSLFSINNSLNVSLQVYARVSGFFWSKRPMT